MDIQSHRWKVYERGNSRIHKVYFDSTLAGVTAGFAYKCGVCEGKHTGAREGGLSVAGMLR